MFDYGRSSVLGAATVLPATSAAGIYLMNISNPYVIASLVALNVVALIITGGMVTRYLINRKEIK